MDEPLVADSLERIIFAGVAMTTVALASVRPGFDLTFPQWRVVVILGEEPDGLRLSAVAQRIGVTLPATSRQLKRLERRGLVTVTPDDRDRRAARARLTEEGWQARRAVVDHRRARLEELARPFESRTATRRELARVAEVVAGRER